MAVFKFNTTKKEEEPVEQKAISETKPKPKPKSKPKKSKK
jgi:hypothetical protein